jgi:hypothetical protein
MTSRPATLNNSFFVAGRDVLPDETSDFNIVKLSSILPKASLRDYACYVKLFYQDANAIVSF